MMHTYVLSILIISSANAIDQRNTSNRGLNPPMATMDKASNENVNSVDALAAKQASEAKIEKTPVQVIIQSVEPPKVVKLSQNAVKVLKAAHSSDIGVTRYVKLVAPRLASAPPIPKGRRASQHSGHSAQESAYGSDTLASRNGNSNQNSTDTSSLALPGNATQHSANMTANITAGDPNTSPPNFNPNNIEVVILQPRAATTYRPPVHEVGQGRRFPSAILAQPNITLVHSSLFRRTYAPRSYWPIYLTLAMMCLCVLGICIICCSSGSRRNMSGPPPEPPKYFNQELPPYPYSFSYDMRAVESHPPAQHH